MDDPNSLSRILYLLHLSVPVLTSCISEPITRFVILYSTALWFSWTLERSNSDLSEWKQILTLCALAERALATGKKVASKNKVRNIFLVQHLVHWRNGENRTLKGNALAKFLSTSSRVRTHLYIYRSPNVERRHSLFNRSSVQLVEKSSRLLTGSAMNDGRSGNQPLIPKMGKGVQRGRGGVYRSQRGDQRGGLHVISSFFITSHQNFNLDYWCIDFCSYLELERSSRSVRGHCSLS